MRFLRWIDRNHWFVPVLFFVGSGLLLIIWCARSRGPILISDLAVPVRQQMYSSLTGTSSSLLGFIMAAVAILAAFGPRSTGSPNMQESEKKFARARGRIIISLLVTGVFLLVVLVTASLALATDTRANGNSAILVILASSSIAGVLGLLLSGLGLSLAVIERSRK